MIFFFLLFSCKGSYVDVAYCTEVCANAGIPYKDTTVTLNGRVACTCGTVTPANP